MAVGMVHSVANLPVLLARKFGHAISLSQGSRCMIAAVELVTLAFADSFNGRVHPEAPELSGNLAEAFCTQLFQHVWLH
jgi:hypothetical protein